MMNIISRRLVMLVCFAVFSMGSVAAFSMDGDGSGTGILTEKLKVKGCGSGKWPGEITGFSMRYDGTWSLTTSRHAFTGTYTDIKPDKSFNLIFSPSSYASLISGLEVASDDLCGLAPETSSLTEIVVKKFTANLNKKWTTVSIKLALAATRQDEVSSSKISYALKSKIDFVPTGCSGEAIGTLRGSDALVYCGNTEPAVITADNALELLTGVFGGGNTAPVLSTASVNDTQNVPSAGVLAQGVGPFAQRLARQLFNPSLYSDAKTDTSAIIPDKVNSPTVQAASISINETEPCDNGTLTLKGKLSNEGIGVLSILFNECLLDGDVFNGSAQLTIKAFDLGYLTFTDAVMEFELLSSSGVSGDSVLSGTVRDQLDMASNTETLTLDVVIKDGMANRVYKTENLVIASVYDNWMYPSTYSETINGRFYDAVQGYVDVATLQPLAFSGMLQTYPDEGGSLLLTGAGDSSILFTVLSTTTASLAVDTDGDGVAEYANIINTSVITGDAGTAAAPVAAGGDDQVAGTDTAVLLDSSGSFDPNGDLLSYSWEVVSEPVAGAVTFTSPHYPVTEFSGSEPGLYLIKVTASDGVNVSEDFVSINLVVELVAINPLRLNFQVIDAEYSNQLNRIVMVATNPNTLHVLDPVSGSDVSVALPLLPTSVSIRPDGQFAAVGHDGYFSYIDLSQGQLLSTYSISTDVLDIVLAGNGYVYAFPRHDQWENIRCIELATGNETLHTGNFVYAGTLARLHPNGTDIYGADNGLSPSDIEKYSIAGGTAQYLYDSPYHGTYAMGGELWFTEDGSRIFTRSGNVFQSSSAQAQDMLYSGSLPGVSQIEDVSHSIEAGELAVIPGSDDTVLRVFEDQFLTETQSIELPLLEVGGQRYHTHGLFVFFSDSGVQLHVIAQVDGSAGLQDDILVITYAGNPWEMEARKSPVNTAPVAKAGDEITTPLAQPVSLDGTASYDSDDDPLTYQWEFVTMPDASASTLSGGGSGTAAFTPDLRGTYVLRLTVSDGQAVATDTVSVSVQSDIHVLGYQVLDAEYSDALERIIIVSASPPELHIYDPLSDTGQTVVLPLTPTSVSVSPDGPSAVVGHDGYISHVDLDTATVLNTFPVTAVVGDIVHGGNGYAYAFPESDQWVNIHTINLTTGVEQLSTGNPVRERTRAKLHPAGAAIYGADNGLSPSDIEKYSITSGNADYLYDSPYHGDFPMCGNLWITEDGERIFTACGNTFRSSPDQAQDMIYNGSLSMTSGLQSVAHSAEAGKVIAAEAGSSTRVDVYGDEFLAYQTSITLPQFSTPGGDFDTYGRFVFYRSDGSLFHVLLQADPAAGASNDYGVATYGGM
jgi:chitinase